MKKLGVYEYAKMIGVTPKTVYKMVEKGEVITTKEVVNNREVKRIVVDDEEILSKYPHVEEIYNGNIQKESDLTGDFVDVEIETSNFSNLSTQSFSSSIENKELLNFMEKVTTDIAKYAELAGQVKLLTDSEHKTKEEYFKVIQENATLKAKIEMQQQSIKQLEETLTVQREVKNNSWWSKL